MDAQLPGGFDPETRERRLHQARLGELPDGALVLLEAEPRLVIAGRLLTWTPAGYTAWRHSLQDSRAQVITPPSLIAVLETGWNGAVPLLHPSAGGD